jgi:hypothetical protein
MLRSSMSIMIGTGDGSPPVKPRRKTSYTIMSSLRIIGGCTAISADTAAKQARQQTIVPTVFLEPILSLTPPATGYTL